MVQEIFASDQIGFPVLSLMVFLPLVGAIVIGLLREDRWIRWVAMLITVLNFGFSILLFARFERGTASIQFAEQAHWISPLGISYHVGVDGINLLLVLLTTLLFVLIILLSWDTIKQQFRTYALSLMIVETAVLGVFLSLDLVLFFFFWEMMLIPMYFLIKVWGGARRDYAALKYVVYTLTGSVLMLVGIIVLFLNYHDYAVIHRLPQRYSFDYLQLLTVPISVQKQIWIFSLLFFGFAFKVPMVPFHTWLPDAHVEAPTAGSVILAGLLLKMGSYGFLRYSLSLVPDASIRFMPIILTMSVIGIIYGAFLAMVQGDMKKLIAYSSISHMGFVMMGLFALNYQGIQGSLVLMINHGLSTAGLFIVVGFIYERMHTRYISDFGGLSKQIPVFAFFYLIITLSSLGLPGTSGFVGEFLVLLGTFKARWLYAALGVLGVIFGAIYLLWLYQRVMYGSPKTERAPLTDLSPRETAIVVALAIGIFWIGLYPAPFLRVIDGSVQAVVERIDHGPGMVAIPSSRDLLEAADR